MNFQYSTVYIISYLFWISYACFIFAHIYPLYLIKSSHANISYISSSHSARQDFFHHTYLHFLPRFSNVKWNIKEKKIIHTILFFHNAGQETSFSCLFLFPFPSPSSYHMQSQLQVPTGAGETKHLQLFF